MNPIVFMLFYMRGRVCASKIEGSCSALPNDMVFMSALVGVSVKELLCRSVMPNGTATHTLVGGCVRQR
jgi:hypothetical protein